jgi:hypothetical protein
VHPAAGRTLARTDSGTATAATQLAELEPREARTQRAWIDMAEVAEKIQFRDFGEEFLIDFRVSKPDIGPQSRPRARAGMIMWAPCRLDLRFAVASTSSALL